jgi:hypothetical protein
MKRFLSTLRRFFFPAENATTAMRILPLATVAFVVVLLFAFGNYAWEATNAVSFCGLTCHTMPPQYVTHQNSAHANVSCEDCHMGRDAFRVMLGRKIMYSWQTGSAMVLGTYTYPIMAKNMRPARDACENCHKPETFNSDKLVELKHYSTDEKNTLFSTVLSLKIGGGTARQGLGKGIHWHIENPVYYYATDSLNQNIPYILVYNPDNTTTAYIDTEAGFDPSTVKADQLQKMDCITCHNRAAHGVKNPSATVDQLIARDLVSVKIPNIKMKGAEVIGASYPTVTAASEAIKALDGYYQSTFADFYSANKDLVTKAIQALQDSYASSNFPDQKFNWQTHPNNIGHQDSAGCFRCHDGKHLNNTGASIRLECNICHTIPAVIGPNKSNVVIELSNDLEPKTHENANWISLHKTLFDSSCKGCHTVEDAGGTSNKSFCSNSACHGSQWSFAGFDAPKARQILAAQAKAMITPSPTPTITPTPTQTPLPTATLLPGESTPTPGPDSGQPTPTATSGSGGALTYDATVGNIFTSSCGLCHGADGKKGLNLTTYATAMKGSESGAVIIPGDPAKSILVQVQSAAEAHFGQLSPEQLDLIKKWIQAGAPEK